MKTSTTALASTILSLLACSACTKDNAVVQRAPDSASPPWAMTSTPTSASARPEALDSNAIALCMGNEKRDALTIENAALSGDTLTIKTNFRGGCAEHVLGACYSGAFKESWPVQTGVDIWHDANGDTCDAVVGNTLTVDLTPMKERYQEAYRTNTGKVAIFLPGKQLLYEF